MKWVTIRIIDPRTQHLQSLISTSNLFATGVNTIPGLVKGDFCCQRGILSTSFERKDRAGAQEKIPYPAAYMYI